MKIKFGLHKNNEWPHVLWRYRWPVWMNVITYHGSDDPKIYKWLCFYISVKDGNK